MNNLKSKGLTEPPFRRFQKFTIPHLTNKDIIMKLSSLDIICATEHEEFYYEETNEVVPEGEPVGVDMETDKGFELVLFSNIYWEPNRGH
mgnify:CR=1 FL=1